MRAEIFCALVVAAAVPSLSCAAAPKKKTAVPPALEYVSIPVPLGQAATLPNLWVGYSLEALVVRASASYMRKGEFESTDEFDARRGRALSSSVYGSVTLGSDMFIPVKPMRSSGSRARLLDVAYNADSRTLEICVIKPSMVSAQLGRVAIGTLKENMDFSTYRASNAFGAAVEVVKMSGSRINVAIRSAPGIDRCRTFEDMGADRARDIVERGGAVLYGRLVPPFVEYDRSGHAPTISTPVEQDVVETRLLFELTGLDVIDPDAPRAL